METHSEQKLLDEIKRLEAEIVQLRKRIQEQPRATSKEQIIQVGSLHVLTSSVLGWSWGETDELVKMDDNPESAPQRLKVLHLKTVLGYDVPACMSSKEMDGVLDTLDRIFGRTVEIPDYTYLLKKKEV